VPNVVGNHDDDDTEYYYVNGKGVIVKNPVNLKGLRRVKKVDSKAQP
jgi:hypothetical protein